MNAGQKYRQKKIGEAVVKIMRVVKEVSQEVTSDNMFAGGDSGVSYAMFVDVLHNVAYNSALLALTVIATEHREKVLEEFIARLKEANLETLEQDTKGDATI